MPGEYPRKYLHMMFATEVLKKSIEYNESREHKTCKTISLVERLKE